MPLDWLSKCLDYVKGQIRQMQFKKEYHFVIDEESKHNFIIT